MKQFQIFHLLTLSPLVVTFVVCWHPLQTVWTQIRPNKTSGLIWIQTVCHSDGIPERKKSLKKIQTTKSMQTYPACKDLKHFVNIGEWKTVKAIKLFMLGTKMWSLSLTTKRRTLISDLFLSHHPGVFSHWTRRLDHGWTAVVPITNN